MNSRPKKSFGQHFLHDRRYIDWIISAIASRPDDFLIEIGPGEGALTLPLLSVARKLTAIELDTDLIPGLQKRADASVSCTSCTRTSSRWTSPPWHTATAWTGCVSSGNLPYYISSPILFHCVEHVAAIQRHALHAPEGSGRSDGGSPGSKVYGRLSVMLQLACRVEPLFDVPPEAFRPPPKVDSAVVRLVPLQPDELHDADPLTSMRWSRLRSASAERPCPTRSSS